MSRLVDPRWGPAVLVAIMVVFYVIEPAVIYYFFDPSPYFLKLSALTAIACVGVGAGFFVPLFDGRFSESASRLAIPSTPFHLVIWGAFIIVLIVTFVTAPNIPIVSAFQGATENELSIQRGQFLVGRRGWEATLVYCHTVLVTAILPYSLGRMFVERMPMRFGAFALLFAYTQSFLVKALFLQVAMPLGYLAARGRIWSTYGLIALIIGSISVVYLQTVLQRDVQPTAPTAPTALPTPGVVAPRQPKPPPAVGKTLVPPKFFTSEYQRSGPADHLIWRITSVPVFSAADALKVFDLNFNGQHLLGATSSFVSAIFGMKRIDFDNLVHSYQWGATDIGHSNTVFVVEAYVNFGWPGVILWSLVVGQSLRWFYKSREETFKALWLVYVYYLAQGGLLGTLLSNGFSALFFIGLFVSITSYPPRTAEYPSESSSQRAA